MKGGKHFDETLIVVLGDIISCGNEKLFKTAGEIFSYIETELSSVNYKITFIPGNHDYCNGNLNAFNRFCRSHQTATSDPFDFTCKTSFHIPLGDINLIFTDSIQDNNYKIAGQLDLESIRQCILTDKENILFMHHSLLFEDSGDHTGISQQLKTIDFLKHHGIRFVFHGHTHASRNFAGNGDCMLFGVGSIGVEKPGIANEKEQFLEVQISGRHIEAVANWLWRGGSGKYRMDCIYPNSSSEYGNGEMIPRIQYEEPENYIERHVLLRDVAAQDEVTRYLSLDKKTTLFDACMQDRLVLFIADAGLGKTVEMQHLAHVITSKKPYLRPVLLSLNFYDNESIGDYIKNYVPEYRTLDPSRFVLIMDGYDELSNPEAFKKALSKYITANSKTSICISMRSNFLASSSSVFEDFSVYQLLELERSNIELELKKHQIDKGAFYSECMQKGLTKLLSNPFYLENIIEIYLVDRTLPNQSELIAKFIDLQFSKDAVKFEFASEIEDRRYEIERALTRFAYGLQLLGWSSCNERTYGQILEQEDRQLIKHSSLTIVNGSGHSFAHNIFKEYLVARYVSLMDLEEIIAYISIPGTKSLNPNWFNVLGLILQSNSCKELESWVFETEPLALTKLEADRVNPKWRYSILLSTLDSIISKNIWFRNGICSEKQLASFVQSPEAVELLLCHIETPIHFRSLYFCISVLMNFSSLYGAENKAQQVLVNCYQSNNVRSHEKRVAISALATLKLNTPEITDDLIHRFSESLSSNERLGVYEYLQQSHLCDENIDFLLAGIKCLSYSSRRDDELSNFSEHLTLIECLNDVTDPDAIEKAIKWYSCVDHIETNFYNREKLFSSFFDKAADAYRRGQYSLFETVYRFFINATRNYSRYHIPDALNFFTTTGMIEEAFIRLVSEDADDRLFLIDDTIQTQPDLIEVFCQLYLDDKLSDRDLFKKYTLRNQWDSALFEKCAEIIRLKTGEVLEPPKQQLDYNSQRRKDVQAFFDSLFDPQAFQTLLVQLANLYGDLEITYEELRESRIWRERYPDGANTLEITLMQCEFEKERVIDFLDLINWEHFFINRICHLLQDVSTLAYLVINDSQRNAIERVYKQLEEKLDYSTALEKLDENSCRRSRDSWKLYSYMIIKDALNLPSPGEYYLGLLEIPCSFFNQQPTVEEKYALIEQHVSRRKIELRIKELTPHETRVCVLDDLMFGCKRYGIRSCREIAIQMCKRNGVLSYYRRNALEYLLEEFGSDLILNEIMPTVDSALFEMIVDMFHEAADDRLKNELLERYKREPSRFMLKNLVALNVPEGLNFYIEEARKANGIPDNSGGISEVTEAISSIDDVNLLPHLLDAVRMLFSNSFKDGSFHTLYSSLQNALSNCAKKDFTLVNQSIDDLNVELSQNSEAINFCSVLQGRILEENKMSLIKNWTVPEVKRVLRDID